jgi:serine/threonine-protein kinase
LNGEKATARSDIYSVAVTLYEVLTGRPPFTGATNYEIMIGHLQQTPVAPTEVNAVIPPAVSQAVMRALAKDPLERFANASDFNSALQPLSPAHKQEPPQKNATPHTAEAVTATTPLPHWTRPITSANLQPPSPTAAASLPLEELTRQLAVFIGPVAKFVVKKLAAECSDLDLLYAQAAKQIPSEVDRQKFLRARRR